MNGDDFKIISEKKKDLMEEESDDFLIKVVRESKKGKDVVQKPKNSTKKQNKGINNKLKEDVDISQSSEVNKSENNLSDLKIGTKTSNSNDKKQMISNISNTNVSNKKTDLLIDNGANFTREDNKNIKTISFSDINKTTSVGNLNDKDFSIFHIDNSQNLKNMQIINFKSVLNNEKVIKLENFLNQDSSKESKTKITMDNKSIIDFLANEKGVKRSSDSLDIISTKKIDGMIEIKINDNGEIVRYEMLETDTFENLYKYLFKENTKCKLKYKKMNISKYSTLKSTTYVKDSLEEGDVYFQTEGRPEKTKTVLQEKVKIIEKETIGVKVNISITKSIVIELKKTDKIGKILSLINEKNKDYQYSVIIMNGVGLNFNDKVEDMLEELDVIDVV